MFNCCLFLPSRPFCFFLAKRGLVVRFIIFSRVERAWMAQRGRTIQVGYTVNPLLRAYLFQAHLRRGGGGGAGLNRYGGLISEGGLFNLDTTMVSVLHKKLEYKVEKLKYKKF